MITCTEEFSELFRNIYAVYIIIFLVLIVSPDTRVSAQHEFPVYRMHQYDLHSITYGCKTSRINLEARSLFNWSSKKHCVVTNISALSTYSLNEMQTNAGGLLVILPEDFRQLSLIEKKKINYLEQLLLESELKIPVYFSQRSPYIDSITNDIERFLPEAKNRPAWEEIIHSLLENVYRIVINDDDPTEKPRRFSEIVSIEGKLPGYGREEILPTIVIVAHYDSSGIIPHLSFGADSNASGVIMLLELMRIFSQLYTNSKCRGRVNLIFLLSGGGKYNFFGSRKWIDDQLDIIENSFLQNMLFVLCLDAVGSSNNLNVHVSKPPKEDSALYNFYQELNRINSNNYDSSVDIIHKKINLASEIFAWEHERFSINRLQSFTLSAIKDHKDSVRRSILDTDGEIDSLILSRNIETVAQALAHQIYNTTGSSLELLDHEYLKVEPEIVKAWIEVLVSHPREASLLGDKSNPLIKTLEHTVKRFTKDVKVTRHKYDKREPEYRFYENTLKYAYVYSMKSEIFEIFVLATICIYLALLYLAIMYFWIIYDFLKLTSKTEKVE